MNIIFNLICFLIIYCLILWRRRFLYKLAWQLKGPKGLPVIGSAFQISSSEKLLNFFKTVWTNYKSPCVLWLGPKLNILIGDAETAHEVLNSPVFQEKNSVYNILRKFLGPNNLISSKLSTWKIHRKLLDPTLNSKSVSSFIPNFNAAVDRLNGEFQKCVGQNEVDITETILFLIADTTMINLTGKRTNFQDGRTDRTLIHNILRLQDIGTQRILKFWLQSEFIFQRTKLQKEYVEKFIYPERFLQTLITDKIEGKKEGFTDVKNTALDVMIDLTDKKIFERSDIRCEMITFLTASTETSANLIYFAIMCLAMNPNIQETVFNELLRISPNKQFDVKQENLSEMVYLERVMNETMRLLPPVPVIGRRCVQDYKLGKCIYVPREVQIIIDIKQIHRNEKYWGKNSDKFNPDNFLVENVRDRHPCAFLPFSKGSRNCIGQKYAKTIAKLSLAKILRKFKFTTNSKFEELQMVEDIVLRLKHYPTVKVEERIL